MSTGWMSWLKRDTPLLWGNFKDRSLQVFPLLYLLQVICIKDKTSKVINSYMRRT